jgi:hypothetical protein
VKKPILLAVLACLSVAAHADVKVPYFNDLPENDVCGTTRCQPHKGPKYTFFKQPIDFNGKPETFLGRKYTNIFATSPCTLKPAEADLNRFGKSGIKATATERSVSDLKGKIKANIGGIIGVLLAKASPALSMRVEGIIDKAITDSSLRTIDLQYERIALSDEFWDNNSAACKHKMNNAEMVIGGIATVRVSGKWTKGRIEDVIKKLEAETDFADLVSGEAKLSYDTGRREIMNGSFESTAFVIASSWYKKSHIL